jgi:hypothetical protein
MSGQPLAEDRSSMRNADCTFAYLDYGGRHSLRLQMRYSLSTLLAEVDPGTTILLYTDTPAAYARCPVTVVDISQRLAEMSLDGVYHHRVKPCVLLDALRRVGRGTCALLDSDTFILPGFAQALADKVAGGAAMHRLESINPMPHLVRFETQLPHAGVYRYDPAASVMFNSGIIAMRAQAHEPVLEDAIALIDRLIESGQRFPTIEQLAISEVLRLHGVATAELLPWLFHYCSLSQKRYMNWRLGALPGADEAGELGTVARRPTIGVERIKVRLYHLWRRLNTRPPVVP